MSDVQQVEPAAVRTRFLSELRHRLMNHLQMITSVVNLQLNRVDEPMVATALRSTQNRIRVMTGALGLHSSPDLMTVHLGTCLDWLVRELIAEYDLSDRIGTDVNTTDMAVSVKDGIALALIANELVANALEHAFPEGGRGKVRVRLAYVAGPCDAPDGTEYGELEIHDNGRPLASGDFHSGESTGFTLVRTLTAQLRGDIALDNDSDGKTFRLRFPLHAEP